MKMLICFAVATALAAGQQPVTKPEPEPLAPKWKIDKFESFDRFEHLKGLSKLDHGFQFQFQGKPRTSGDDPGERQYERGMRSLDKRQWDEALAQFEEASATGKARADGSRYWKAYALMKLGRGKEALDALDELARLHPQSRWLNDAKAMRVEIAQAAGRPVSPEDSADDEIKIMAINGLVNSEPDRSIPLLEKIITSQSSPKLRERALFVLSHNDSVAARDLLVRIAKGGSNPDLQLHAVRVLGLRGGKENVAFLLSIYSATNDPAVKKQVLSGFMASGDQERLLAVARGDAAPEMRMAAIRHLGGLGASVPLVRLYGSETSPEIRAQVMQALAASGHSEKLIEIAKTEKDAALRGRAIRHLGTMNSASAGAALVEIYGIDSDLDVRKRILSALFTQGNAKAIVDVARRETNAELRRAAVQHLSHMRSKEATEFLMEILNK